MGNYENALKVLNKKKISSIEDIKEFHDNISKKLENFSNLSPNEKEIESGLLCEYLNAMNIVFCTRYKNSQMTQDEYEIWKFSLKDDFDNAKLSTKKELKKYFIKRMVKEINKLMGNIKSSGLVVDYLQEYDKYKIEKIENIEFAKVRINFIKRFIIMLIFLVAIIVVTIFVK